MGLTQMRSIESAKVFSPTKANRDAFAKNMSDKTGVKVQAVSDPKEVVKNVDIILCMTNTIVPVLDGSWLEEGQYIISVVGSNIELVKSGALSSPRREIDDGTLRRCSFIVALSKDQAIRLATRRHLLAGAKRCYWMGQSCGDRRCCRRYRARP